MEYEEIIIIRASLQAADLVLKTLLESDNGIFFNQDFYWNAIPNDPDDNKFFDVAVTANADYIVTNDKHFDIVKHLNFPRINIISADDFLLLLNK